MSLLDNIILAIAPKTAFQRARYKAAVGAIETGTRRYDAGGSGGHRTKGWRATASSPNSGIQGINQTIKARSRDMYENNTYYKKAVQDIAAAMVGTGIRPSVSNIPEATEADVMRRWREWSDKARRVDWREKENFSGLLHLAAETVVRDGEALIIKRRNRDPKAPIQLEVLECDHLDSSKDGSLKDGGVIADGIQYDGRGKISGYHIHDVHPSEQGWHGAKRGYDSKFIARDSVIHLFMQTRPGQRRGVAWGHAAMLTLKDFAAYQNAEIIKQQIAACLAVFVTNNMDATDSLDGDDDPLLEKLAPGIVQQLRPGQDIHQVDPPQNTNHESFTRTSLRGASVGMGTTYENMAGDYSQVNFSSGRMNWISVDALTQVARNRVLLPELDRLWEWFTEMVGIQGGNVPDYTVIAWTPPRRVMLDPIKETNGIVAQLAAGLISYDEAVKQVGGDPDVVITMMAKYKELMESKDVLPNWVRLSEDAALAAAVQELAEAKDKKDDKK